MTHTATAPPNGAPDVDEAFEAALAHDAHVSPPSVPAPPPKAVSADPDAPHGREEDGAPKAPYGLNKKTGRPNLKRPGPGRPNLKDKPRVTDPPRGTQPKAAAVAPDYTADLAGLGTSIWIGASALKGGRLPLLGIPLPDARPYAALFHEQLPQMVGAWNTAAQQSPAVRGWVEKLAGEGSWQWVIGVSVVSANFLSGCSQLADKENTELRANYAAHNDIALREFLTAQIEQPEAAGLEDAA